MAFTPAGSTNTGVAALTNKTIDGDDNTVQDLPITALKAGVVLDDDTMATASATTIPSSESVKAYADTKLAASALIDDDTMATATAANVPSAESVVAYVAANAGGDSVAYDWTPETLPSAANFVDAKTLGATTGVTFGDTATANAIRIRTNLDETATPINAGTNRGQGIVRATPEGDFCWGVRLGVVWYSSADVKLPLDGSGAGSAPSVLAYGAVFVDGVDLSANSFYGLHRYHEALGAGSVYLLTHTAGANRFDAYTAYDAYVNAGWSATTALDYFIKRAGTNLELYVCVPGQIPLLVQRITVSTNVGEVGIRYENVVGETDYFDIFVLKEGFIDDVPPFA